MLKELVIIYSGPSVSSSAIINSHNLSYYLNFFDKINIIYWSEEEETEFFQLENGKFLFYPYCSPYNKKYFTGLKYMLWIAKTLWKICRKFPEERRLILMPVIPLWSGLPALIVAKLKRKKVVLRLEANQINYLRIDDKAEGIPEIYTKMRTSILKIIHFFSLPFYDYVIGVSKSILDSAKKYGAKKTIWSPVIIDKDNFKPIDIKKNKKNPLLLSVGKIKKRKGFEEIIESLKILKEEGFYLKLLITGGAAFLDEKKFFQELKKMATGLDVEFIGFVKHDTIAKVYNMADIFISASQIESLGITIMEAMASGLPVVATETEGARDLVEDGKTGFLVQIKNPAAIAEKIKILLKNPRLRKSMGNRGRERIEEILKKAHRNNKNLWERLLKE